MSDHLISIAFVSGKGGVGKTALAANFAWACSRVKKTILIDLDFQNQGCTGLFAPFINLNNDNAIDSIINITSIHTISPTELEQRLFFLPAVPFGHSLDLEKNKQMTEEVKLLDNMSLFLRHLKIKEDFEIAVLDCHGGLDHVSYASFLFADYVLVVTEPDSVTFSGTLELLKYYNSMSSKMREWNTPNNDKLSEKSVNFIVNRLQHKHDSKYLDAIYHRYLFSDTNCDNPEGNSILCYIPSEEMLANYFGEFPFFIKLDKHSVFSRKIYYLAYKLLSPHFDLSTSKDPLLSKLESTRIRNKIKNLNVSDESSLKNNLLNYFLWFSASFVIFILLYICLVSFFVADVQSLDEDIAMNLVLVILVLPTVFIPSSIYYLKMMIGINNLYKRKYTIEKKINLLTGKRNGLYMKVFSVKVRFLQIMTFITSAFFALLFLSMLSLIIPLLSL